MGLSKRSNGYFRSVSAEVSWIAVRTDMAFMHTTKALSKEASIAQIQEALGHHSATTTQKYLASFDDETKKELSKRLMNFEFN